MIDVKWSIIKKFIDDNSPNVKYIDLINRYSIKAWDGHFILNCLILKDGNKDQTDFENNYKVNADKPATPHDTDNASYSTLKVAPLGWSYQRCSMELETSLLSSLFNEDDLGEDTGAATIKFYNAAGGELTDQPTIDTDCVKTIMDWVPAFDYALIGEQFRQMVVPSVDIRLWTIGLPDYASPVGSTYFIMGEGLKFLGENQIIDEDWKTSKILKFNDPGENTNKIRSVFKHPAGFKHKCQIVFVFYRP